MFQYKNEAQNITQIFGINLKKYIGSKNKQFEWFEKEKNYNKSYLELRDYNQTEDSKSRFQPSWRQVLP